MKELEEQYFCPYPFYHICTTSNSNFRVCCHSEKVELPKKLSIEEWWDSDNLKSIRENMLNNIPTKECNKCYQLENSGLVSPRKAQIDLLKNDTKYADRKIGNIKGYKNNFEIKPLSLDIRFSNRCNLKCRMCDPFSSSSIGEEIKNNPILFDIKEKYWVEYDHNNLSSLTSDYIFENLDTIERLRITGGEPFYTDEFYQLLDKLERSNRKNKIRLKVISNGTFFSPRTIEQIKKSPIDMHLEISIDGIGEVYEYIRYPVKWNKIKRNIINFRDSEIPMVVTITVQILNILSIVEMFKWFDQNSIIWDGMLLDDPNYYNIDWLPEILSKKIIYELNQYHNSKHFTNEQKYLINNIIKRLEGSKFDKEIYQEFLKITHKYDLVRNQSFEKTHSILSNTLKDYDANQ